jgi:hypothetical protein
MVDINTLMEQVHFATDANGKSIVQVPVEVWDDIIARLQDKPPSSPIPQPERLQALLKQWAQEPTQDSDNAWWDDFETFIKEHRFSMPARDIGLDDE